MPRGPNFSPSPHSHPHPFLSAYSLPTPHQGRTHQTVPSCSKSLLTHWFTHSCRSRKPKWVSRFWVISFFLLLGCRLWVRTSINSDGDTVTKGSVKGTRGLFSPTRICLWIIQTADDQDLHRKFWVICRKLSVWRFSVSPRAGWGLLGKHQKSHLLEFGLPLLCLLSTLAPVHSPFASEARNVDTLQQFWKDWEKLTWVLKVLLHIFIYIFHKPFWDANCTMNISVMPKISLISPDISSPGWRLVGFPRIPLIGVLWEQSVIFRISGDINFWRRRGQERMVLDGSKAEIFIGGNLPSPSRENIRQCLVIFLVVATEGVLWAFRV